MVSGQSKGVAIRGDKNNKGRHRWNEVEAPRPPRQPKELGAVVSNLRRKEGISSWEVVEVVARRLGGAQPGASNHPGKEVQHTANNHSVNGFMFWRNAARAESLDTQSNPGGPGLGVDLGRHAWSTSDAVKVHYVAVNAPSIEHSFQRLHDCLSRRDAESVEVSVGRQ